MKIPFSESQRKSLCDALSSAAKREDYGAMDFNYFAEEENNLIVRAECRDRAKRYWRLLKKIESFKPTNAKH